MKERTLKDCYFNFCYVLRIGELADEDIKIKLQKAAVEYITTVVPEEYRDLFTERLQWKV